MKKALVLALVSIGLFLALGASSCGSNPPPQPVKATMFNGTVVATFYGPTPNDSLLGMDWQHRHLELVFKVPGTYTETFAMGPSEATQVPRSADHDKKFVPKSRTFTASSVANEDDVYQTDWPTYFTVTITGPDGTSDTVELYSN